MTDQYHGCVIRYPGCTGLPEAVPGNRPHRVLDSVVPMQLALGQEHAPMLDRSVAAVFEDCARDETCNSLYPRQAEELNALFMQLRKNPGR